MIISASRRTDIAAFYSDWFLRRVAAGYCEVRNPYNRAQVSQVSLAATDVDAIVFWTRNPAPLMRRLDELDGYRYYFQYTIVDNGREYDGRSPSPAAAVKVFRELASRVGAGRVVWRYDPIVGGNVDGFRRLATALAGSTRRCVVSLVDTYRKTQRRMAPVTFPEAELSSMLPAMVSIAAEHGMEMVSCAEEIDLVPYGVRPGRCVDGDLLREAFGIDVDLRKDPTQRAACGCVASRDIGAYDTCLFECRYCYATSSFDAARARHASHDPGSASLI